MKENIILVDFSFAKYVSVVSCVSSFLVPPKWKRLFSLFSHQLYLADNPMLEKMVSQADFVILFDTRKEYDIVAKRIEKVCKDNAKLVFYSWNPLSDSDAYTRLSKRWIKTTFSKKDATDSDCRYVGSFYFKKISPVSLPIRYDGVFIGQDKGRRGVLHKVSELYGRNRLLSKIILVNNRKAWFDRRYSWHLDYDKVCKYVQESKTVIEILQEGQEGISLRVFESLFYEKKLLTNNLQIVNYDFYDPCNVFILGKDDEAHFKEFILSPYVKVKEQVIAQYTMESWLSKMLSL